MGLPTLSRTRIEAVGLEDVKDDCNVRRGRVLATGDYDVYCVLAGLIFVTPRM